MENGSVYGVQCVPQVGVSEPSALMVAYMFSFGLISTAVPCECSPVRHE